jgi:single-stranded-DNA-specific exonuclease
MDHARGAFDLLMSENPDDVTRYAMSLDRHNQDRREATEVIVAEARAQASSQSEDTAIVVAGEGWPAALAGLVASRLMDDRNKPVISLGKNAEGNYVGSGRSIPGFDITAALRECSAHILKFGGHPRACGMTIVGDENFEAFKAQFKALAKEKLQGVELVPRLDIEETLTPSEAKLSVVESVRGLEPHGEGNPKPLFQMNDVRVIGAMPIGADGAHLRMTLADEEGGKLQCIGFRMAKRPWVPSAGDRIDAVVELDINEWNGTRSAQGKLVDFRQHV